MPHDHEISVGENIFEIAARTGFSAEYLWDLPQNKKLADLRIHMNVLLPRDVLHIPDTQSSRDERRLPIQCVGVKDVRYPLQVMVAGWPLGYWIAAQGAVLVFIGIVVVYAWAMSRFERQDAAARAAAAVETSRGAQPSSPSAVGRHGV